VATCVGMTRLAGPWVNPLAGWYERWSQGRFVLDTTDLPDRLDPHPLPFELAFDHFLRILNLPLGARQRELRGHWARYAVIPVARKLRVLSLVEMPAVFRRRVIISWTSGCCSSRRVSGWTLPQDQAAILAPIASGRNMLIVHAASTAGERRMKISRRLRPQPHRRRAAVGFPASSAPHRRC